MPELVANSNAMRANSLPVPIDRAIADLAAAQYGVVSDAQLVVAGLSRATIKRRVAAGRLHRLHCGVYAVGHRGLGAEGTWLAAVLACGPHAVLSHRAAAAAWELRLSHRAQVDITLPRGGRSRAGVDLHLSRCLSAGEIANVRGIPCTSVARTLADLAALVAERDLRRAFNRAELRRLLHAPDLERQLRNGQGRKGIGMLRRLVDEWDGETATRSELEDRFLELCRGRGIERPRVNARMTANGRRLEVDFLWEKQRVAAETDGWATHRTRAAFEADRRRDADLMVAGLRVVRFTWGQVTREPAAVAATLRALLA
jgi:very-short-patch-repair endonuclease